MSRGIKRSFGIVVALLMVIAMFPAVVSAAKSPGTVKLKKVSASGKKLTVKWSKAKSANKYKVYSVTYKYVWKYIKKVTKAQKKKYKDTTKYKVKKSGKKYKVYKKTKKALYKAVKNAGKKTSCVISGKYASRYTFAVRAFNGKKGGKYSNAKSIYIKPDYNSYDTYVFFGSDSRATGDAWKTDKTTGTQGAPTSDIIMLLKVNKASKSIDLVSVYRDTFLDVSGNSTEFEKANMAFAYGGPTRALKMLEDSLDIKIKGYVSCNFKGVADAIDSMGGITHTIENELVEDEYKKENMNSVEDVMNSYIDEMNKIYGTSSEHVKAGKNVQLDGIQTVAYARVRYSAGSDKQRSVRQREILSQMSTKFKKLDANTKIKVLNTIVNAVDTDINFGTLFDLYSNYSIGQKLGFPFYKRDSLFVDKNKEWIWVVTPADLENSVTRLHNLVYKESSYEPSTVVKKYGDQIRKQTFYDGDKNKITVDYKHRQASQDNKF